MNDSELIDKAQAIGRCLSYNDKGPQADAKHIIHELCHRLGARGVVIRSRGGFRLAAVSMYGYSEALTLRENVLWRLFRVVPTRFYDREARARESIEPTRRGFWERVWDHRR